MYLARPYEIDLLCVVCEGEYLVSLGALVFPLHLSEPQKIAKFSRLVRMWCLKICASLKQPNAA